MTDVTRKRLQDLLSLLERHPDGLTTPEIAEALAVSRVTALKDINRLSYDGVPIYQEGNRYCLDPSYHRQISLSLEQAWFMYLPLRRIVRAEMHRYPLVRGLLYRVATLFDQEVADQLVQEDRFGEIQDDQIFATLVQGWHKQHYVEVT